MDNVLQKDDCSGKAVWDEFMSLSDAIDNELSGRKLVFVPPDVTQYLEQAALFGPLVFEKFESARAEIRDAGNCLATDLPNAAVFHLMRVAELGLRAIAKRLKVRLPVQIEFATWGRVIEACGKQLDVLKGKTAAKDKKAQFYSALILDIRAFSHLWRNPVMHARSRYDKHQAQSAFNHVRSFMQHIAERSGEIR